MGQKHDKGWVKRNNRPEPAAERISGEALAHKLVNRGLASTNILDRKLKPQENDQ